MRRSDHGPGRTLLSLFWLGQLVFVATLGCQERPASKEEVIAPSGFAVTAGTPAGYVEDRACGASGCHDELYRSFLETDKGKSFHRPGPDHVIEDIEDSQFFHKPSQRYYQVIRRDDRFVRDRR